MKRRDRRQTMTTTSAWQFWFERGQGWGCGRFNESDGPDGCGWFYGCVITIWDDSWRLLQTGQMGENYSYSFPVNAHAWWCTTSCFSLLWSPQTEKSSTNLISMDWMHKLCSQNVTFFNSVSQTHISVAVKKGSHTFPWLVMLYDETSCF